MLEQELGSKEPGLSSRNKVMAGVIFVVVAFYRGTLPQTEKAAEEYFSSVRTSSMMANAITRLPTKRSALAVPVVASGA